MGEARRPCPESWAPSVHPRAEGEQDGAAGGEEQHQCAPRASCHLLRREKGLQAAVPGPRCSLRGLTAIVRVQAHGSPWEAMWQAAPQAKGPAPAGAAEGRPQTRPAGEGRERSTQRSRTEADPCVPQCGTVKASALRDALPRTGGDAGTAVRAARAPSPGSSGLGL